MDRYVAGVDVGLVQSSTVIGVINTDTGKVVELLTVGDWREMERQLRRMTGEYAIEMIGIDDHPGINHSIDAMQASGLPVIKIPLTKNNKERGRGVLCALIERGDIMLNIEQLINEHERDALIIAALLFHASATGISFV